MKIALKKILDDAKFTAEQHALFREKLEESIESKNPSIVVDFLNENLETINDETMIAITESLVEKLNSQIVEEGEEVGDVSNTADMEQPDNTHAKILSMLKPIKEKSPEFDYQILDSQFDEDSYIVTIRQYDEERMDSFIVSKAKGHTMADFKKWLDGKVQLYLGGHITGKTYDDGLQVGKDAYPDPLILTKEELESEYGKGITEGFNRAKKGKEITEPETYNEPLSGKTEPETGDADTVSDDPSKRKTSMATKEEKKKVEDKDDKDKKEDKPVKEDIEQVDEKIKKPKKEDEKDYKEGYDEGYADKAHSKEPSVTDEDTSGFANGYRNGYKDSESFLLSKESINYDSDLNTKLNTSLEMNVESYISEKSKDILKGDDLKSVVESIKSDIRAYTSTERYAYIMERFVESLHKHGINNVAIIREDKTITKDEIDYINNNNIEEGTMKRNYPAKMDEPKGKDKEPKSPDFGGANTTVSDDMYADFAKKNAHKIMAYAEAKAAFEKMFNIKIMPEGEEAFKARINNEIALNGEGKSASTVSDKSYNIFKERSNAMAWDEAKKAYEMMFNIKLMPEGESTFKTMLNQDDLLASSGKADTTVSDKITGIGGMVDGKSKLQEEVDDLKSIIKTMSEGITVLTESITHISNKTNEDSINTIKGKIVEEATKEMNEADKMRFETLAEAIVFKSEDSFKSSIGTMRTMFIKEDKERTAFVDEDLLMSEVERRHRSK